VTQQPKAGPQTGGSIIVGVIVGILLYRGLTEPLGWLGAVALGVAGMVLSSLLTYWVISWLVKARGA
jgi:putative flippase GtrA